MNQKKQIFDKDFMVDRLVRPQEFLPKYQQSQDERSIVQDCNICCGVICTYCCALPFAACGCFCCGIQILPTSKGTFGIMLVGIVQQFGKFKRLLNPGFNLINPCSDSVQFVSLKLKVIKVNNSTTLSKDTVQLYIQSSLAYRITNPIIAHYILGNNIYTILQQLTISCMRQSIGEFILDDILSNRQKVVNRTKQLMLNNLPAGIMVDRIFIENINLKKNVQDNLNAVAKQKRISQAKLINDQSNVETAKLMKQSSQLLDSKAAMQIRYLEMVQELGKKGVTVLMNIGVNNKGY